MYACKTIIYGKMYLKSYLFNCGKKLEQVPGQWNKLKSMDHEI